MFKTGATDTGVISADQTYPGYSQTELEYSLRVIGDKVCQSMSIQLRLTGYAPKNKTVDCNRSAIVKGFSDLFNAIAQQRGNTPAGQVAIEERLFQVFIAALPAVFQRLEP